MGDEKMLRKIRALLAQAEDPATTPEEAETFSAKAQELMVRYSIDHALIEATKPGTRETPVLRKFATEQGYTKPKMYLLAGIAGAFPTHVVRNQSGDRVVTVDIIGYPSDLDLIDTLYTSLLLQASHALSRQARSDRSFRTSFWYGFAQRAGQRAAEVYQRVHREAVEAEASTALVLVSRTEDVAAAVRDQYANQRLGKVSSPSVRSRQGFESGREAANRADLGGTRFSGGRKALA